jgi:hypothetical protein
METKEMTRSTEVKANDDVADRFDGVVMRRMIDMLPGYNDEAWRDISPEYREGALQDLGCLMCDIDFAKDTLKNMADKFDKMEAAIVKVLNMQPTLGTNVAEACQMLREAIDA